MKKIRVCGVGSVLLGDDAVGPYMARWIADNYLFEDNEFGASVEVEDLGTPGLDLIAYMTGIDVLILIDSCDNRKPAGAVTVYDKAAITRCRPAVRLDPHSPCITESIFIAEMAGDGPEEVYLIGITGEQFEVGAALSEAVRNAIPMAVETVLERVAFHGGSFRKREIPADSTIWWEAAQEAASV
ncbi:MAG: hydrogenase maturation protease [Candidatus Korobacteraceae bacterium]